jgi:protease-4
MGSVAASGGYWIATAGDVIFAEPETITGSIGVFGILPSFEGALQKLGVGADGIKTTPLSGEPDLLRGPSDVADRLLQTGVDSTYRRFLSIVSAARKLPVERVDQIAQGRVWDGGTARQLSSSTGSGDWTKQLSKRRAGRRRPRPRPFTWTRSRPSPTSCSARSGRPRRKARSPATHGPSWRSVRNGCSRAVLPMHS